MPLTPPSAPEPSLPAAAPGPLASEVAALHRPMGCQLPAPDGTAQSALPCKATVCPGGCRRRQPTP